MRPINSVSGVMDFKTWIIRYKDRESRRGDLAYDISKDARFPNSSDKEVLLHYLKHVRQAIPEAVSAFREAYRAYRSYLRMNYDAKMLKENESLAKQLKELERNLMHMEVQMQFSMEDETKKNLIR
ncbi:YozE family protein [Sporosarcina gallistercoris]|uniref:YozE family protein n=1 Tax=Sporosarcina gallistercoris TaxID=2762245 RepID=UPI003D26D2C2